MMAVEARYTSEGLMLMQHQPTRRQRAHSPHHFTVPTYKMGEKPHLKCWCGTTTPLNHPHIEQFVHAHQACEKKASEA